MGNSPGHSRFLRGDSKRYSKKINRAEKQQNMFSQENKDTQKVECLQHLKECLAVIERNLEAYDKNEPEQSQEIEGLLKEIAGHKGKELIGNVNEDNTGQQNVYETLERCENFMRQCQILGQNLKDSFKEVRSEINKCVEVFEEQISDSDRAYSKTSHEQGMNKAKRYRIKEAKQTRDRNNVEEIEQEKEKVQIFCSQDGHLIQEAVQELIHMLTSRIDAVEFIQLREKSSVDESTLLIIICIVSTRVGADATNAVENIKSPDKVALLLIHVVEAHAVTNKDSRLHLTGNEFANLRGIFDMSFKAGNGFFQCEMNERSKDGLTSFCKQNHKQ